MILEHFTKETFAASVEDMLLDALMKKELQKRFAVYTDIMDTARSFGTDVAGETETLAKMLTDMYREPDMWELPETFGKEEPLPCFPVRCLPEVLRSYLEAVAAYVQVVPEMGVLPLLSVLSLCVQGKAVVRHPGNDHTEPLNLYTITVAAPGERKSGCFREFMRPAEEFEEQYNRLHQQEVDDYQATRAFLEHQKQSAMKGKSADLAKAKELSRKLSALQPVSPLRLNINDVTPEGLAWEMFLQGGKIGVVDDEGSVFDVLSGLYSGGTVNINIFLKAYDGSSYTIVRRTKEDIALQTPLLTMGLMVQPEHFGTAMQNKQFSGRGFIHRFLYSFPESLAGHRALHSENIPADVQRDYRALVFRLLSLKTPGTPHVLTFGKKAVHIMGDYFDALEGRMREDGALCTMKEWGNKQFGRCMKLAGILHLCSAPPSAEINEQTALDAVTIAEWAETHAIRALAETGVPEEVKNARYILGRLQKAGKEVVTKRELLRYCRALSAEDCEMPLGLLEDMNCIRREIIKRSTGGKAREQIRINPLITL